MSKRGVAVILRCSTLSPSSRISPRQVGSSQTWRLVLSRTSIRGAKTRTTVKASSLPQGLLPPLPPTEDELPPPKQYPTVLQQHLNNVRKFDDCVVLTRVGDFYEMYFDQVHEFAPLVNLKIAKRATTLGDVPMAGFQMGQLDRYLKMFVQDLGKKVAISEQIRLPEGEGGSGKWDRKVTRVITPGTLVDEGFMDPFESNFLLAVHVEGFLPAGSVDAAKRRGEIYERYKRCTKVGLSWVDLSSGDFFTQSSDLATLPSLIARIGPRETVVDASLHSGSENQLRSLFGETGSAVHFHHPSTTSADSTVASWSSMLERPLLPSQHASFPPSEVTAGNLVLDYVRDKLPDTNILLQPPVRRSSDEYMAIDKQSLRGLEIRMTLRDHSTQGSLVHAVRRTVTKSGARLVSQRLVSPSMSLSIINARLDLVQELLGHDALREDVVALLRRTSDTLRLLQRFSIGKGDADDLVGLATTIDVMGRMTEVLHDHIIAEQARALEFDHTVEGGSLSELSFLWDILGRLDLDCPSKVVKAIKSAIDEDGLSRQHSAEAEDRVEAEERVEEVSLADDLGGSVAKSHKRPSKAKAATEPIADEIWVMRRGASLTLERAHSDLDALMSAKHTLAQQLRQDLKADSLSLKWSAQLGHFCHVKGKDAQSTLAALPGARSIGSTKSTRSFYLADWTHLGVRIDDSKLRIRTEEERVFGKLRAQVIDNLMKLRRNAAVLDELDVACSSATVAKERNLIRPILNEGTSHNIIGGRHPTVDIGLEDQGRVFTANDCAVGGAELIYLITGPNMAGKSTYLRQTALITILAQTGCFVPAAYAEMGLVDKIFSRVGSADNLFQDQSTFMVEMLETAEILKQATPRSFVIMDEVGRGTTPEDGVAVGYACLHHLYYVNKCRTLFATHFHGLADMTRDFEGLACYCTDVAEEGDGSWAYVHKLKKGVNRASHALKVARLAGLPEEAVQIAAEVLADLQRGRKRAMAGPPSIAAAG